MDTYCGRRAVYVVKDYPNLIETPVIRKFYDYVVVAEPLPHIEALFLMGYFGTFIRF